VQRAGSSSSLIRVELAGWLCVALWHLDAFLSIALGGCINGTLALRTHAIEHRYVGIFFY
jgi:hypothetical protein